MVERTELWDQECPDVGGLAFDHDLGKLYIAERLAGPFGEGIIHVYQLDGADAVFADGFESGDTTAWSGIVSPVVESRQGFMVFQCREVS